MIPREIDLAFPARPESSPLLRAALRAYLARVEGLAPRVEDVVLAVGEATSNAIEHAYRDAVGSVRLSGFVRGRRLVLEVRDDGRWRLDGDGDRGRGLGIMRALVDHVAIESTRGGTSVRLEVVLV